MIDEVPQFNSLSEIQAIEAVSGRLHKHIRNGHTGNVERSLLKKSGAKNLEELASQLHQELIRSTIPEKSGKNRLIISSRTHSLRIFKCSSLYTPNLNHKA